MYTASFCVILTGSHAHTHTLGLQDIQYDPEDLDDFSTPEDDRGKAVLAAIQEEKRKRYSAMIIITITAYCMRRIHEVMLTSNQRKKGVATARV